MLPSSCLACDAPIFFLLVHVMVPLKPLRDLAIRCAGRPSSDFSASRCTSSCSPPSAPRRVNGLPTCAQQPCFGSICSSALYRCSIPPCPCAAVSINLRGATTSFLRGDSTCKPHLALTCKPTSFIRHSLQQSPPTSTPSFFSRCTGHNTAPNSLCLRGCSAHKRVSICSARFASCMTRLCSRLYKCCSG